MSTDDIAICVSNLSKCYQIYDTPRDRLKQFVVPRLQRLAGQSPKEYFREFWALRDVSFKVRRSDVVGIIGRNGSGKSTLLKAICGTLNPSSGSIEARGRIAALLELGSGFNPEFTGRENVYLNAAVLGMRRDEIDSRFEDIESFANIGDFIDQPVKTYSSGMFVRLAFAVAIHVDPDILIVDESLSVGDIGFQNKCIEILKRMVANGVTILFVTHDLSTLQLLCTNVIWLDNGRVRASGDPVRTSQEYYVELTGTRDPSYSMPESVPVQQETGRAVFTELSIAGGAGRTFAPGDLLRLKFSLCAEEDLAPIVLGLSIYRADGDWVVGLSSRDAGIVWPELAAGTAHVGAIDLAPLALTPGEYLVALGAFSEDYSLCFALTGLSVKFSVRSPVPTWGKFLHPCRWIVGEPGGT